MTCCGKEHRKGTNASWRHVNQCSADDRVDAVDRAHVRDLFLRSELASTSVLTRWSLRAIT